MLGRIFLSNFIRCSKKTLYKLYLMLKRIKVYTLFWWRKNRIRATKPESTNHQWRNPHGKIDHLKANEVRLLHYWTLIWKKKCEGQHLSNYHEVSQLRECIQWRIQGRGPGDPGPHLIFSEIAHFLWSARIILAEFNIHGQAGTLLS